MMQDQLEMIQSRSITPATTNGYKISGQLTVFNKSYSEWVLATNKKIKSLLIMKSNPLAIFSDMFLEAGLDGSPEFAKAIYVKSKIEEKIKELQAGVKFVTALLQCKFFIKDSISNNLVNLFYKYGSICVTRHGINIKHSHLPTSIEEYNETLELHKPSIHACTSSISASGSSKEIGVQKILHPFELAALESACETLKESEVVLIDIFERSSDGKIKTDSNGIAKVHTVVLSQRGNSLEVVDPSNSTFSSHLASDYNTRLLSYSIKIQARKEEFRLYTPLEKQGARDCIDIAVKAACFIFEFL